ncbi:hypothetical protein SAMCFNEI73_pB0157 (plasmid) [Sinorhizobium americanum]|uniref:Uncharacterized protein n=1 Tax=Sinorhizobium americanum TaxID=194963 RepID=A0A1L3LTF7_9HYPH|nr:hypothetical protein SAMCFNEI73_pB0157 [Sinorhizobium americanum]
MRMAAEQRLWNARRYLPPLKFEDRQSKYPTGLLWLAR